MRVQLRLSQLQLSQLSSRWRARLAALVLPCCALPGLALLAAPASAVTIDWVFVGGPGNASDTASNCVAANCGSVPHEYSISKFEVTNAQYAELLNAKASADPLELYNPNMGSDPQGGITRSGSSGSFTYAVKPGFADKPVNFVSFFDALRFTNWLHNGQGSGDTEDGAYTLQGETPEPSNGTTVTFNLVGTIFLPSENEWYKAAYYDPATESYFAFPAGSDTATVCAAPTGAANRANCFSAVGGVTRVGAYAGSASPNGTFDQGGNVREWNEQIADGSFRGIRGGAWRFDDYDLAASARVNTRPTLENDNIGFRVASLVPEPDANLLAAAASATLVALRKRSAGNL